MKLDEQRFLTHIKERLTGGCEGCGQNKWTTDATVYEMREFTGGGLTIGAGTGLFPIIPVTCTNCGTVRFVNPIAAGLLDNSGKPK